MPDGMIAGSVTARPPRVCVGIATRGRPQQLTAMLDNLARQTMQPERVIVCCSGPDDVGALHGTANLQIVYEKVGLPRQRNGILRALPEGTDIIVFFDDDFYPDARWIETVAQAFQSDSSINCVTGHVIADGIIGPGYSKDEALACIAGHDPSTSDWVLENESPYGCNMAFRCSAISGLSFDEKLVLYGWLEDRDFGASVAKRGGRHIRLGRAFGVHLGVKGGRVSGRKFGYSQVMNPVYMHRKKTMTTSQVITQISRNLAANCVKSLRPEPYVDRRGRLIGNLIAALDLLRFRLTPERAASL
jgi:GT2 family glycosyltransferase